MLINLLIVITCSYDRYFMYFRMKTIYKSNIRILYQSNTQNWIFFVRALRGNSSQIGTATHGHIILTPSKPVVIQFPLVMRAWRKGILPIFSLVRLGRKPNPPFQLSIRERYPENTEDFNKELAPLNETDSFQNVIF